MAQHQTMKEELLPWTSEGKSSPFSEKITNLPSFFIVEKRHVASENIGSYSEAAKRFSLERKLTPLKAAPRNGRKVTGF